MPDYLSGEFGAINIEKFGNTGRLIQAFGYRRVVFGGEFGVQQFSF